MGELHGMGRDRTPELASAHLKVNSFGRIGFISSSRELSHLQLVLLLPTNLMFLKKKNHVYPGACALYRLPPCSHAPTVIPEMTCWAEIPSVEPSSHFLWRSLCLCGLCAEVRSVSEIEGCLDGTSDRLCELWSEAGALSKNENL